MERKEALQRINNLINFANEALKEDCPLNHYGMTCTSHRVEYQEEHRGKEE